MKTLFILLALSQITFAQSMPNDPSHADLAALKQDGKLVSIQIVPHGPLKIFVVGREEARLDLADLKLTVRQLSPGPQRLLSTMREADHFTLSDEIYGDKPANLEVTTKTHGKSEIFHFTINNQPH
jgi:hypothetical protein